MSILVTVAMAGTVVGCTGSPKQLEPRTPPQQVPPAIVVPTTEIPAGHGRVVLDATDGPMQVSARADTSFVPPGATVAPTRSGELCTTPCVLDLPQGRYKLFLVSADGSYEHGDTDTLTVGPGVNYHVRAPGKFEQPTWLPVVPAILSVAAIGLIAGGSVVADPKGSDNPTMGGILIGSGLVTGILAGVMGYDEGRGSIQAGSTTSWATAK